ncbi:zinc finger protein 468 [Neodiprion lecontei]|uniref:Zinc finger protein 468 n=1 Tax=Neodiprion lecontei TaxID=441921 RepID=A0A6J0BQ34_NEOLC|nr:zinc finger protein 468 [Neodiprion lecontei]
MRLKTIPRQRMTVNLTKTIAQDARKEFLDIGKHTQIHEIRKKSEASVREGSKRSTGVHESRDFSTSKSSPLELFYHVPRVKNRVEDTFGAMNLSVKDSVKLCSEEEKPSGSSASETAYCGSNSSEEFAGSMLYQIMTDPTFVDNIRQNKQAKKLTCQFCKEKFGSSREMDDHLESRGMNEHNQITCCACKKTFGQKRYLRYHQRCHIEKNKYPCGLCPRMYTRMDNLTRHRTFHTNPDKYPCNICERSFSRKDLMTKHLKTHEGKKFNCKLCKQSFYNYVDLQTHRLVSHMKNNRT